MGAPKSSVAIVGIVDLRECQDAESHFVHERRLRRPNPDRAPGLNTEMIVGPPEVLYRIGSIVHISVSDPILAIQCALIVCVIIEFSQTVVGAAHVIELYRLGARV